MRELVRVCLVPDSRVLLVVCVSIAWSGGTLQTNKAEAVAKVGVRGPEASVSRIDGFPGGNSF